MNNNTLRVACAAFATMLAMPATAIPITYITGLSGAAESPPVDSDGTGSSTVLFDADAATLQIDALFSGLTGTTTVAHIHCCTDVAFEGTAGVASQVPTFLNFPTGVTSGNYAAVFDLTLAENWNPAFINANGGTPAGALTALAAGLEAGEAYFNIHTSFAEGGEIRGFYTVVPLPAGIWLLGTSIAAAAAWRGRRALRR